MRNYYYVILAAISVGTIGLFVKLVGDSLPPMVLNFYRIFFGLITLAIICPIIDKNTFKLKKKDVLMYLLIGFLVALSMSLTNIAYLNSPVQNVTLIMSITPFFVLLFAYYLLKEKITKAKLITLFIAIVGLVVLNPFQAEGTLGNFLALAVAGLDGIMVVLLRKEDKTHSIGDAFWFLFFALLFLIPFPIAQGFYTPSLTIILLGVITAGLQFLFLNLALEKVEAEISSIMGIIITPFIAITLAYFFLDEALTFQIILGGAILIFAGIYMETHSLRKKRKQSASA
ncbi:MAG: DMT family transporter [Patescibacteria group bacterium]